MQANAKVIRRKPAVVMLIVLVACAAGFIGRPLVLQGIYLACPAYELHMGAGNGDRDMMEHALRQGADVNAPGPFAHRTPLMVAALHGRVEAARLLLAHGADAGAVDDKGYTALRLAAYQHHADVARLLTRPF